MGVFSFRDEDIDDDDDEDELEEEFEEDIEWGVDEEFIRKWIRGLEADHIGWTEEEPLESEVPVFETDTKVAKVLDTIPHGRGGLETMMLYLIEAEDGHVLVLFDDRPKDSLITDSDYERGVKRKLKRVKKVIGDGWTRVISQINEDNATRAAWIRKS